MSDNWVVQAMQSAFEIWNDKLTEIWSLITTTPQEFRDGDIWNAIVGINEGLKAVGYGLLVLFFAMGIFQSAASFRDLQRPEYALRQRDWGQGSKNVEAEKAAIDRHNEDEGHHRDKQVAQHGYQPERDAG